jgi:hypothetical protein
MFRITHQDTSAIPHAHAYALIGGGLAGAAAVVFTVIYLTRDRPPDDYGDMIFDYPLSYHWLKATVLSIMIEPIGMATGVHLANRRRGDYGKVVGSAYGSFWIAALAIGVFAQTGIGRDAPGFYSTLILAIPIYQLSRTIRKELRTSGGKYQP